MPRLAVIADSHFDEHSRFAECIAVHQWIAMDVSERKVDLIVHTGDVLERRSTPAERRAIADWIRAVTQYAPLVIVRGNHDPLGDLPIFERLQTRHPVYVVETAVALNVGGFSLGCLAWPSKASILALGATSHAEGELVAGQALRNVMLGLGDRMDTFSGPRVLVAHAMVRGSTTSVGQPLVGCDLEVGIEDLALARADFVALGHIHKGQAWNHGGHEAYVYPGSPRRTSFGEVEPKGYLIVDFDAENVPSWQLVETPCARMFLAEDEWGNVSESERGWLVGWHGLPDDPADVQGAEIRLRYRVPADMRDEAASAAAAESDSLLQLGAVNVKVEAETIAAGAARAPEVAKARTVGEKLLALWKARGNEPDQNRVDRLLSKVTELEEKSHAV